MLTIADLQIDGSLVIHSFIGVSAGLTHPPEKAY